MTAQTREGKKEMKTLCTLVAIIIVTGILGSILGISLNQKSGVQTKIVPEVSTHTSPALVYTVDDLPDGWTLWENHGRYRIKDPTGALRLPLTMWSVGDTTCGTVHIAVNSAIQHQISDDLKDENKWKNVH